MLNFGPPAHKHTDPHAPTHTYTYHSTHNTYTHMECPHTLKYVRVHTSLMCDYCCIPRLPQSRELVQQWCETADMCMWVLPLSCSALAPRKATQRLLPRFRDFEHPEHAPRSPPGTQNLRRGVQAAFPACPAAESARKDPRAPEKKHVQPS